MHEKKKWRAARRCESTWPFESIYYDDADMDIDACLNTRVAVRLFKDNNNNWTATDVQGHSLLPRYLRSEKFLGVLVGAHPNANLRLPFLCPYS